MNSLGPSTTSPKTNKRDRLKRWWRTNVVESRFIRWVKQLRITKTINRSLSFKITASMILVSVIVLSLLTLFVSSHIRSGLYEERQTQILADAARRLNATQASFDQATVSNSEQVQDVAYRAMQQLRSSVAGAGGVGTLLLRDPRTSDAQSINEIVEPGMRSVVSDELRQAVENKPDFQWQPVAIPASDGDSDPGIVVGTTVNLPIVGTYEVYIVYSLATEEANVRLVMQVLVVGSLALLVLLTGLIWAVSYQIMLPIIRTAQAAKKLSAGDFNARVVVSGEDELAVLGNSFNNMADSLQAQISQYAELARLQQRFVSDVSHELRTPLTTIRMATHMIYDSKDELSPLPQRSAELLNEQVDRFDSMLADLLEISRFDAQTANLVREEHDLVKLIKRVIADNQFLADNNGVEVIFDPPNYPCVAAVDELRIERIVRNLLVNAYEHAEGKPVRVELAVNETTAAIRVRDYGVGMTDEVARHVFDRFYRADPARPRTSGGTGLGLAICAEDTYLHQGQLSAIGCPHSGSAFLLAIPVLADGEMLDIPLDILDDELSEARIQWAQYHPDDIFTEASLTMDDSESEYADIVEEESDFSDYEDDDIDYDELDQRLAEEPISDEVDRFSPGERRKNLIDDDKSSSSDIGKNTGEGEDA